MLPGVPRVVRGGSSCLMFDKEKKVVTFFISETSEAPVGKIWLT